MRVRALHGPLRPGPQASTLSARAHARVLGVDIDVRLIERWRPEDSRPEVVHTELEWRASAEVAPLVIDLAEMWREAEG